jgi:hypothetical protein
MLRTFTPSGALNAKSSCVSLAARLVHSAIARKFAALRRRNQGMLLLSERAFARTTTERRGAANAQ